MKELAYFTTKLVGFDTVDELIDFLRQGNEAKCIVDNILLKLRLLDGSVYLTIDDDDEDEFDECIDKDHIDSWLENYKGFDITKVVGVLHEAVNHTKVNYCIYNINPL